MKCDNCQNGKILWNKNSDQRWPPPTYGRNTVNLLFKRDALYMSIDDTNHPRLPEWNFFVNYTEGGKEKGVAWYHVNVSYVPEIMCSFKNADNESTWTHESYGFNTTYHGECHWKFANDIYAKKLTYKMYTAGYVTTHLVAVSEDAIFENVHLAAAGPNTTSGKPRRHLFRCIDDDGIFYDFEYTLRVRSSVQNANLDPAGNMKLVLDTYQGKMPFGSVKSEFESGDFERTLQMLYALSIEMQYITKDKRDTLTTDTGKFRSRWQWTVLEYLKQIPLDSLDRLNQATSLLYATEYVIKDRKFRIKATDMLKIILKKYQKFIQDVPYTDAVDSDLEMQTNRSFVFALTCTRPSPEDLIHDKFSYSSFNFTTPKYFLDLPVVMENYPNYDDADLQYAMKLKDRKKIKTLRKIMNWTGGDD